MSPGDKSSVTPTPSPRSRTTELAGPRPTTGQATQPSTCPAPNVFHRYGDDKTLLVAEVERGHRYTRMCITTDDEVRAVPHKEFDELLKQPQNKAFASGLYEAWKASTQPAKKPTSPASSPATSQAATSQAASGPAISGRPATATGGTKPNSG